MTSCGLLVSEYFLVDSDFIGKGLFIVGSAGPVAFKLLIAISSLRHCIFDILSLVYRSSYSTLVTNFNSSVTCTPKSFINSFHLLQYTIPIDSKIFKFLVMI